MYSLRLFSLLALNVLFISGCEADATSVDAGTEPAELDASLDIAHDDRSSDLDVTTSDAVDATDAGTADATSLEGPVDCGSITCGTGQLCVLHPSGVDAGAPSTPDCEDLPVECGDVVDCGDGPGLPDCCALPCADAICPDFSDHCGTRTVRGRQVQCLWG